MLYVDKTAYFHKLLTGANDCFFLARPWRFGKSLMISTFKAIFEGRKELFGDLAIAKTDWKWEKYPVIHFNLGFAAGSLEEFKVNFPPDGAERNRRKRWLRRAVPRGRADGLARGAQFRPRDPPARRRQGGAADAK